MSGCCKNSASDKPGAIVTTMIEWLLFDESRRHLNHDGESIACLMVGGAQQISHCSISPIPESAIESNQQNQSRGAVRWLRAYDGFDRPCCHPGGISRSPRSRRFARLGIFRWPGSPKNHAQVSPFPTVKTTYSGDRRGGRSLHSHAGAALYLWRSLDRPRCGGDGLGTSGADG